MRICNTKNLIYKYKNYDIEIYIYKYYKGSEKEIKKLIKKYEKQRLKLNIYIVIIHYYYTIVY